MTTSSHLILLQVTLRKFWGTFSYDTSSRGVTSHVDVEWRFDGHTYDLLGRFPSTEWPSWGDVRVGYPHTYFTLWQVLTGRAEGETTLRCRCVLYIRSSTGHGRLFFFFGLNVCGLLSRRDPTPSLWERRRSQRGHGPIYCSPFVNVRGRGDGVSSVPFHLKLKAPLFNHLPCHPFILCCRVKGSYTLHPIPLSLLHVKEF